MSDEEDYMSDAFLAKCIPEDVRPGLKRTHATQREHEILKRKSEFQDEVKKKKSKAELEEEMREEGLKKSIDSSNKGFALLAKMGYKAGESLGKSNSGRIEPIPIELKNNRCGLGREKAIQQVKDLRLQKLHKKTNPNPAMTTEDFRASQSLKLKAKRVESDLFRAQKACRQLDMAKDFVEPVESWFWPNVIPEASLDDEPEEVTEEEGEVEFSPEEMLPMVIEYVRSEHLFCIFCGINFENPDDMANACPGSTRDDHDD